MAKKVQLKERGTNVNIYPVTVKEAVGLGNVDNTSDANKPISTATQAALDELSKDIEIQNILSQLEPSADITKDLIIEMNDGTVYSVPNIDWTVKGEGNPKAASVNFSNSNFADLWVQGSEYLPKFKRVISYGDLSSVNGRINIYQIPGKIPHMWPNNAPDYELLLPLEQQEPPVIPEINVPREFGLSNLKLKPGYDLTFQCSGNIPFGIFYLTDFEGTQHDDSPRKYDHELTFTNVTTNSKLGEIFYGAKLDPRGIHITGLDGKVEKDGSMLLATRANLKWLPAKKDTKPAHWSFDLSKYSISKKDFEFKGSYIGEDRFTKDNPMDMDWFGISQFSGHIFVGVENLKYIKASLPKATSVTYMSMSPFLEGLEITELGDADVANIVNACPNIRYIKINMSNVTNANNMFYAANGSSDYLYKNLTEVKLEGLKSSIDLSNLAALSLESVRYIFTNAVHILNKTITLYTDVYNKVPKAWIDEMAEKGWTVASSDGFSKFGKTANALKEDINYLDNKIENYTKVFKTKEDLETAIAANTLDCKLAFVEEPGQEGVYIDNKFYQTVPSDGKSDESFYFDGSKGYWENPEYLQWLKSRTCKIEWVPYQVDPQCTCIDSSYQSFSQIFRPLPCVYNSLTKQIIYYLEDDLSSIKPWYMDINKPIIDNTVLQNHNSGNWEQKTINGELTNVFVCQSQDYCPISRYKLIQQPQSSGQTYVEVDALCVSIEDLGQDITYRYKYTFILKDPTKYEEVKSVYFNLFRFMPSLDGRDGEVMVLFPEMYIKSWETEQKNIVRVYVEQGMNNNTSQYKDWEHIPSMLVSAYKCTILNEVPENMGYLSTLPVGSAVSIMNNNTYCRGGKNDASKDGLDQFQTQLDKCRSDMTLDDFREAARKSGKEVLSYKQYKFLYWICVFEHGTFNSQKDYEDLEDPYANPTGGLGFGITNIQNINTYNGGNPICPNGYTNDVGRGGVKLIEGPTSTSPIYANRWHHLENFFGDTYTGVDGMYIVRDSTGKRKIYTTDNPEFYGTTNWDSMTCLGEFPSGNYYDGALIGEWRLGDNADLIPLIPYLESDPTPNTYKCDHIAYDNNDDINVVSFGGQADSQDGAGIGCINLKHTSSYTKRGGDDMIGYRTVVVLENTQS